MMVALGYVWLAWAETPVPPPMEGRPVRLHQRYTEEALAVAQLPSLRFDNYEREDDRMQQADSGREALKTVSVEQFTEVTFNAVLRAIDAQKFPHGPIIYGIIYMPEGVQGAVIAPSVEKL